MLIFHLLREEQTVERDAEETEERENTVTAAQETAAIRPNSDLPTCTGGVGEEDGGDENEGMRERSGAALGGALKAGSGAMHQNLVSRPKRKKIPFYHL